jgi:hypothetical protein
MNVWGLNALIAAADVGLSPLSRQFDDPKPKVFAAYCLTRWANMWPMSAIRPQSVQMPTAADA